MAVDKGLDEAEGLPLGEATFRALREALRSGIYKPGDRLREEEVAERLKVSRTPVREAFGRLVSKGLVVPGGLADEAGVALVRELLALARTNGVPVLAFADGVALAAQVFGIAAEAPGAVFRGDKVALVNDRAELSAVVATIA